MTDKKLPENIQKWLDALRSGKYTQQQGTLKGPDGYCCLGVYCSIMGKEPPEVSEEDLESSVKDSEGPHELYDFCRKYVDSDIVEAGINMNDNGYNFSEIADMVEKEW